MRIFYRFGAAIYHLRWLVLALWALVLVVGAVFAPRLAGELKGGGFGGTNSESERVQNTMVHDFGVSPATLTVVFESNGAPVKSETFACEERKALAPLRKIKEVRSVRTYQNTKDERFVSRDGKKTYAIVGFNVSVDKTQDLVNQVRSKVRSDTLKTYVTGAPAVYLDIQNASNEDIRSAEKYAFPFALVILVVAFGTLVAAGVPVVIGGASVVATLGTLYFVANVYDMSIFALTISTMLGLGLGIDYALFAVSRFREELESFPVSEAVARTVATSGRSIFFSGLAVLIGLSGLLFFPFMFLRSIGVAGALVVGVSVTAALTLLPAVLSVLGHRIDALAIRRGREAPGTRFFARAAEVVMRRPVAVILVVAAVLAVLVFPVFHLKLAIVEATALPNRYESRAGDDILKKDFDYATLNPMEIVATLSNPPTSAAGLSDIETLGERIQKTGRVERVESVYTVGEQATRSYVSQVEKVRERIRAEADRRTESAVQKQLDALRARSGGNLPPGVVEQVRKQAEAREAAELQGRLPNLPPGVNANGKVTPKEVAAVLKVPEVRDSRQVRAALDAYVSGRKVLLEAPTKVNPYSQAAYKAVDAARAVSPPSGASFLVGGLSAGQADFISSLYGKAPLAAAFVLGVTYLVLFLTFRSAFIPLKAVFVNILSLSASFGAMVFVFQDGHLSNVLGFVPLGFVDATLPVLMFCTIFGVSMDYEVFLLSRIREAYESGDSNTTSVAKGLTSTAGIITSAAAIIIVVTGAFAFSGIVITKAIGLGLAVAVLVDATIIRILLVPAAMRVLGDWNWWPGGRRKTFHAGPNEPPFSSKSGS